MSGDEGRPFKPRALYYHVFPRGFLKWAVRLMPLVGKDPKKFGRNGDIDLTDLIADFPVHASVDIRSVAEIKRKAGEQHASQGGIQMRRGLMGFVTKVFGEKEDYMHGYPLVNGRFVKKRDLFDGV